MSAARWAGGQGCGIGLERKTMRDMLLIVIVVATFAGGYFVMARLGLFWKNSDRGRIDSRMSRKLKFPSRPRWKTSACCATMPYAKNVSDIRRRAPADRRKQHGDN